MKKRYIAYLVVLADILGGIPGLVVCVEENGHIAIEAFNRGCCGHSTNHIEPASVRLEGVNNPELDEKDTCQSCVDIPIMSGITNYYVPTRSSTLDDGISIYTNDSDIGAVVTETQPEKILASEPTNEFQSLALLHTTVQLN